MDEGDVIAQKPVVIAYRDNVMDVHNKIVLAGRTLLQEVLAMIGTPAFRGRPQDSDRASYYPPRKPSDGLICWRDSAEQIRNLVRALTEPYPGAFFDCNGRRLIVDEAECVAEEGWPGALGLPVRCGQRFGVRTGKGVLLVEKVREVDMHHEEFMERSRDVTSLCREHRLA
jgi:UDP-4-amino-4-deoxy-L-arabinose formyltransferase/UDP-glucuronic acid dehydrogenase (UDP-4-keto-hexauronic acid decarboxylating)